MKFKYKYSGEDEKNLPLQGINVKPGETIETDTEINNPDFELIEDNKEQTIEE